LSLLGVVSQQVLATAIKVDAKSRPRVGDFAEGLATRRTEAEFTTRGRHAQI